MYRTGVRDLEGSTDRFSKQLYNRVLLNVRTITDSFIGYFGEDDFVELVGNPAGFSALCISAGLDEFNTNSILYVLTALKDSVKVEMGVGIAGGAFTERFVVPKEIEHIGEEMGLAPFSIQRLIYSSRIVAKIDDAAVQDGYRLWLHVFIFSRNANWAVIQIGCKSTLNRIYHWFSGRVVNRSFVDEPHTGLLSDVLNRYSLDFTLHENESLREATLETLTLPINRLRNVFNAVVPPSQMTLNSLIGVGQVGDENPLKMPVKINWKTISLIHGLSLRDFEELLSVKGIGAETLRFLAICANKLLGINPSLIDRADLFNNFKPINIDERVEELFYELLEAVKYSRLNACYSKMIVSRLLGWWGSKQHN
ncbi:MAG: DUF763 domain-containing protein [Nitrososphaerota archaeon]